MRIVNKLLLAAVVAAVSAGTAFAATPTTLNVFVHDQHGDLNPVRDVMVAAVEFGMNGPSTFTQVGYTDGNGKVSLTLENNHNFNIYYSTQGYSPTISDQSNNPSYDPSRNIWTSGGTVYSTFTVTSGLAKVGRIVQRFTGATPNTVMFGGVYNMAAQLQAGSGIVLTDNFSSGTLVLDNIPYALANTYNINLYDPTLNRGIGRNVMSDLNDTTHVVMGAHTVLYDGPAILDFNQSVPPARVDNSQVTTSTTGASVEGVLQEVGYATATIPNMGISIKACIGNQWNSWVNTDSNGRFQLYGLTPGVTYYLSVMGGCTWTQAGAGACYEPSNSPNYNAQDICTVDNSKANSNDIFYSKSDVMFKTVTLKQMAKSTGKIKVCVKSSSGFVIPNSNVNLNPDSSPWPVDQYSCQNPNNLTNFVSNPGYSNANVNTGADGCALLDGLPSGNYMVNIWTPFTSSSNGSPSYNGGTDGQFSAWGNNNNNPGGNLTWAQSHCSAYGSDDYRVAVDTDPATNGGQVMHVYNSSGNVVTDGTVALSSITYIVTAGGNTSGIVRGTVTFPAVTDLRNNPISITLYGQCNNGDSCPVGNFTALASSGADHYPYSIHVSSGFAYSMNVSAVGWGRINTSGGDNSVHLESSTSAVINMQFTPAGTLAGTVYKPDGTVFVPASNQYVSINADANNGWASAQVQKDGSFQINGVLPGVNQINLNASSNGSNSFNYSLPSPAPAPNIVAGATTTLNINLVNANYVGIALDLSKVPDQTVVLDPSGSNLILGFKLVPLSAGSVFTSETITKMLVGSDSERKFSFSPITGSSANGPCGNNWAGGFCPAALPSPGVYDFYLMRSGDFSNSPGSGTDLPYPHFTMIDSLKNVIVDTAHSTSTFTLGNNNGGGTTSGVQINMTPAADMHTRGNATVYGAVTALNFFRPADYDATGGDFNKFVEYLPVIALYNENTGAFSAAGVVVPSPVFIAANNDAFNLAFAQGYPAFKALLATAGSFGYEIRDLAPNTCYTEVMTTPNYPHYQRRICTGAGGSRVSLDIDIDAAVGAGGTVQGVIMSSDTVPAAIPGASVELDMEGSAARTAVASSTGAFRFDGISGGIAKITITAPGCAMAVIEEAVSGSNVYTENVFLSSAPGSITGTVYSQKLPYAKVQAGAQIVAYDDTYNGLNPTAPLPLLTAMTGADGTYTLAGLVPGDLYKVFLKVTGKYTLEVDTTPINGLLAGVDFTMLPKPLDIDVFAKDDPEAGTYDFTVLNPQDFNGGTVTYFPQSNSSASTDISHSFSQISNGELVCSIPRGNLVSGQVYVLHIDAESLSGKTVTKELLFGIGYDNSQQNIDALMLGDDSSDGTGHQNNEASVDKTGSDPSALVLPAGALITSTVAAVPACSFTSENKNSVAVSTIVAAVDSGSAVAGNLYTVTLSSVAQTDRSVELTLAYSANVTDVSGLSVAQYDASSGKWTSASALPATINPVKGTITVKLKKLASVLSKRTYGPQAVFDGRQYVVRTTAGGGSSASGTYTVLNYTGGALSAGSAKLKVFNYPNPFNLKTKNMSNSHGATLMPATTYGTMIHVEVPAANDGPCHIRIYTLGGELVKDISDTCAGGKYNYFAWDGRNKGGQEVANGVYYGVVDLTGKKPDREDATFKMVVIK